MTLVDRICTKDPNDGSRDWAAALRPLFPDRQGRSCAGSSAIRAQRTCPTKVGWETARLASILAITALLTAAPALGCGVDGTGGATNGTDQTDELSGSGDSDAFWEDAYDPNRLPDPSDGNHNSGENCMTCHSSGDKVWTFAGTVYESDGITGAAHVQVGILVDGTLRTTYSATNGNFWLRGNGGSIDWASAEARVRNGDGEAVMGGPPGNGCNACHSGDNVLIEP